MRWNVKVNYLIIVNFLLLLLTIVWYFWYLQRYWTESKKCKNSNTSLVHYFWLMEVTKTSNFERKLINSIPAISLIYFEIQLFR